MRSSSRYFDPSTCRKKSYDTRDTRRHRQPAKPARPARRRHISKPFLCDRHILQPPIPYCAGQSNNLQMRLQTHSVDNRRRTTNPCSCSDSRSTGSPQTRLTHLAATRKANPQLLIQTAVSRKSVPCRAVCRLHCTFRHKSDFARK